MAAIAPPTHGFWVLAHGNRNAKYPEAVYRQQIGPRSMLTSMLIPSIARRLRPDDRAAWDNVQYVVERAAMTKPVTTRPSRRPAADAQDRETSPGRVPRALFSAKKSTDPLLRHTKIVVRTSTKEKTMRKLTTAMAIIPMIVVAACSNSSVQTTQADNGEGTVTSETSASVLLYSMDQVIGKAFQNADEHCRKAKETQASDYDGGFVALLSIDLLNDELKKLKDLAETGKGIFDIFPSHTYKVTGKCK